MYRGPSYYIRKNWFRQTGSGKVFRKIKKALDKLSAMRYDIQVAAVTARLPANTTLVMVSGSIAQLGEHLPYKQRVTGSSPVVPTKKDYSMSSPFIFV